MWPTRLICFNKRWRLCGRAAAVLVLASITGTPPTTAQEQPASPADSSVSEDGLTQDLTEIPVPVILTTPTSRRQLSADARLDEAMNLVSLRSAGLVDALAQELGDRYRRNVSALAPSEWISREGLEELGLELGFDAARLEVQVSIPLELTRVQDLDIYRPRPVPAFAPVAPASFSAALPFWLDGGVVSRRESDPAVDLESRLYPAVQLHSWVLESTLSVTRSQEATDLEVDDTRLVHTWPESRLRVQAGQVVPATRGLQVPKELLAVSLDNLQADNDRSVIPALFDRPLVVDAPGTLDVLVNGRKVRSVPVQPGQYNLQSLPVSAGVNTVEVVYRRDSGGEERFELVVPYAGGLVEPGAVSFAVAAGVEESEQERPAASGFVRYGLRRGFTVGVLADASTRGTQAGAELTAASPLGETSLAGYGSADIDNAPGWAARAGHRVSFLGRPFAPVASVAVEYRDPSFVRPSPDGTPAAQAWQVTSSMSQLLPGDVSVIVSHVYRNYHDGGTATSFLYGTMARRIGRSVTARVSGFVDLEDAGEQWGVTLGVVWQAPRRSLSSTASGDLRNSTVDLGVTARRDGSTSLAGNLGVQDVSYTQPGIGGVFADGRVAAARFDSSLRSSASFENGDYQSLSTTARFGSGLYLAGGSFAVARPIRGAFALVRPGDGVPTDTVLVRRGLRGGAPLRSGVLGSAVVGPLEAYSPEGLVVDVPGIPADYSLRETEFLVESDYRSGTAIVVEASPELYVRGVLLDENGDPVPFVGIEVFAQHANARELVAPAFSDETGSFDAYGLLPGEYRGRLQDGSGREFRFSVPTGEGPLVEIGEIELSGGEE